MKKKIEKALQQHKKELNTSTLPESLYLLTTKLVCKQTKGDLPPFCIRMLIFAF